MKVGTLDQILGGSHRSHDVRGQGASSILLFYGKGSKTKGERECLDSNHPDSRPALYWSLSLLTDPRAFSTMPLSAQHHPLLILSIHK